MAIEGAMLRDGNTVAAANYYNPSSALDGPNGSGQYLAVGLTSAGETSAVIASAGVAIFGILQNTPLQGDSCDVCVVGISKAVAGGAITAGAALSVDANGRLVTQSSANLCVGYAKSSAAAAGDLFDALILPGAYT